MDDFIRLPYSIYNNCPQYVPDLESDVRDIFNPKKNPAHDFSQIQPFVAYRDGVCRTYRGYHQPQGQQEMERTKCQVFHD